MSEIGPMPWLLRSRVKECWDSMNDVRRLWKKFALKQRATCSPFVVFKTFSLMSRNLWAGKLWRGLGCWFWVDFLERLNVPSKGICAL